MSRFKPEQVMQYLSNGRKYLTVTTSENSFGESIHVSMPEVKPPTVVYPFINIAVESAVVVNIGGEQAVWSSIEYGKPLDELIVALTYYRDQIAATQLDPNKKDE